jgi:hypothetical protein
VHPVEGYLGGVGIVEPILDVGDMRSYSRATAGLHLQRGQQRGYVRRVDEDRQHQAPAAVPAATLRAQDLEDRARRFARLTTV